MSSRRTRFLAATGAAALSAGLIRGPARAAQFEFKCASNLPTDHPINVRLAQMWATVEQESGGRIHTQFFPNSLLGGSNAMFGQLRAGALHFFLISPGNLAAVVPVADVTYVGFAFKDVEEGVRVVDGPLGAYVRSEALAKGIYVFRNFWDAGMLHVAGNAHAIRTPDDLPGFKVRVSESRIVFELFRSLGASPTPISSNEMYVSLQTKLIDGVSAPLATVQTARLYEVCKFVSLTSHAWGGEWVIANGDTWKSLPPDLQAVIERNHARYEVLARRDIKALNATLSAQITAAGVAINPVDQNSFRRRLRGYYAQWESAFGPTAWGLLERGLGRKLT